MNKTVTIAGLLLLLVCFGCKQEKSPETIPTISPLKLEASQATTDIYEDENEGFESNEDQFESISESRSNAITRAVEKASPAIVSITVTEVERGYNRVVDPFFSRFFQMPAEREVKSIGSGFIIREDGLIVTNEHVASKSARKIVVTLSNGDEYEAELLGSDELADLALLKIKEPKGRLPKIKFSDSETAMVGEWAIAMGNPFGLFDDGQASVTVGVISATKRDFRPDPKDPRVYIDMIQTDAAINRGNSGGPLVNSNGEVVGVNTFIFTGGTSNGFVGLGFAIPANRVKKIIKQLEESGEVALDFDPGMEFTRMTSQIVYQYGVPSIHGLFITSVNKNGPAYDCGIMPGDIITKIGGERVSSEMHAWALMREFEEGEKMSIILARGQNQYEAVMTLRKRVKGKMSSETSYTILVVDDDKASHIIVKNLIGKKYELIHAKEPQQAINILSEKKIDLILSDIHMPEMTGLEFLEAIKKDSEKKDIPILLMTSLPTVEKEQQAMDLGAKDFIKKEMFHQAPQEVAQRIEMKLVTNLQVPDLSKKLAANQKALVQDMMVRMESMDFLNVSQEFCHQIAKLFELEHLSFWKLSKQKPNLLVTVGSKIPADYNPEDLYTELVFRRMIKNRKPYFTNNIYNSKLGVFIEESRKEGLAAEIGVPMFAVTESDLIKNHMKIPGNAPIFGYILMKRSKVFSTKEYAVLSKLIIRCSTMIWRLYKMM